MRPSEVQYRFEPLGDKVREIRQRWFVHVQRRDRGYIGRMMVEMQLAGKRQRGRLRPWRLLERGQGTQRILAAATPEEEQLKEKKSSNKKFKKMIRCHPKALSVVILKTWSEPKKFCWNFFFTVSSLASFSFNCSVFSFWVRSCKKCEPSLRVGWPMKPNCDWMKTKRTLFTDRIYKEMLHKCFSSLAKIHYKCVINNNSKNVYFFFFFAI